MKTGGKPKNIKRDRVRKWEIFFFSSVTSYLAQKPIQTFVFRSIESAYKHIAPVDQNDLEIFISVEHDTYIDFEINIYVRGKLTSVLGLGCGLYRLNVRDQIFPPLSIHSM